MSVLGVATHAAHDVAPCAARDGAPGGLSSQGGGVGWGRVPPGVSLPEADVVVVPRPWLAPELDDDQLIAALVDAEAVGRRVDALRVALAAEAAERSRRELGPERLSARRGCRNAVELVQRATGASVRTVSQRIRVGAATRGGTGLTGAHVPSRFPAVAWGLQEGRLGLDAASAVVDTLAPTLRVADRALVEAAESAIVEGAVAPDVDAAPQLDADSVRLQAVVWRAALDPDGSVPSEIDVERRCLVLGARRHGLVPVRGMLLPEVAVALDRYADAWTNPRTADLPQPAAGREVAAWSPLAGAEAAPAGGTVLGAEAAGAAVPGAEAAGAAALGAEAAGPAVLGAETVGAAVPGAERDASDAPPVSDQRSRAQRLHDVLATALSVAARAADAPSVAGNAPTLVVTVRQEDLASGRGVAWVGDDPVGLAAARQVGCAGVVETVIMGRGGRIVGLGSRERCFTGQQRRAIAVRDGTCVIPGCHVPAGWCEVHHVTPHATDPDGTHTDNGVLLCWFHHRTLDASGWEVRMRGGVPEVRPPRWLDADRRWRRATAPPG